MLAAIFCVFLYRCCRRSGVVRPVGAFPTWLREGGLVGQGSSMRSSIGRFPFTGEIVTLYKAGNSAREVANHLGVSKSHVLRVLNKEGIVRSQAVAQHLAAKKKRAVAVLAPQKYAVRMITCLSLHLSERLQLRGPMGSGRKGNGRFQTWPVPEQHR